uniref:SWIM-type domain-containing protein n=1 Tax=Tanacetum cinerariifolium TaxID=118510 RepID=A0A6L2MS83_TANCI|nr:hypothetical protein CTI12_AA208950 [Tanacetum cinerariifolium]
MLIGMTYSDFFAIIRRLVLVSPVKMFYKTPGMPLTSLKELATDDDVVAFVKDGRKLIITMLEDIRIYLMQRMWHMNKKASELEDTITPSVRRQLEHLKIKQRFWLVFPSAFQEVEVRRGDEAYGVNLNTWKCSCGMWELSGILCVHAVAAYTHMKMEPELEVKADGRTKTLVPKPTSTKTAIDAKTRPPSSPPIMPPEGPPEPRSSVGKASGAVKKGTGVGIGSPIKMGSVTATRLIEQEYQIEMDYKALAVVEAEQASKDVKQEAMRKI